MGINDIIAVNRNSSLPVILSRSSERSEEAAKNLILLRTGSVKGRISLRINPMKGR